MPENDKILAVVHEWTAKAENDLKNAVHTLKMRRDCPAVGFARLVRHRVLKLMEKKPLF